jgi:hypothetical protein
VSPPIIGGLENPPSKSGGTFFALLIKAAGITRKELQYDLRLSKTYVDLIMSGDKHDPLSRSRDVCRMLARRGRGDLIPHALVHIAGGDDFDGRVLTAEQNALLKQMVKALVE